MAVKYKIVRIPEPLYNVISQEITHSHNNDGVSGWVTNEIILSLKVKAAHEAYKVKKINEALRETWVKVNEKAD